MSRIPGYLTRKATVRSGSLLIVGLIAGLSARSLPAQTALGTPFIGANNLSYHLAELTRSGGAEITRVHGISYGHRFGAADRATHTTMVFRGSARPFDDVNAGVLDVAGAVGLSHASRAVTGLSVAASAGVGVMAWGDDIAKTGRMQITIPVTAGAGYDLRFRGVTLSPFAKATIARYDLRTYLDDERQSLDSGWDASYTSGVSVRLKEVVFTSTRIVGEHGMPERSRWAFSAGISY